MTERELELEVVVYQEGDGYVAKAINVSVASEGDTEQEALENLREALELYFDDEPAAAVAPVEHVRLAKLTV
jgi:predicted RNase H-like HicB family nuclease